MTAQGATESALLPWPCAPDAEQRSRLAEHLLRYVREQRWFRGKARAVDGARVHDVVDLGGGNLLVILTITYRDESPDLYAVPVAWIEGEPARRLADNFPRAIIVGAGRGALAGSPTHAPGALIDGLGAEGFAAERLYGLFASSGRVGGESGEARGETDAPFAEVVDNDVLPARVPRTEQSNSSAMFGSKVLLKVYRHLVAGPNPELEMGRYLGRHRAVGSPRVLGALWYRGPTGNRTTTDYSLAIAHELIDNQGDAWAWALVELRDFFSRVGDRSPPSTGGRAGVDALLAPALAADSKAERRDTGDLGDLGDLGNVGMTVAKRLATLGERTGELHLALAEADTDDGSDFAAEPLTAEDRAGLATHVEKMLGEAVAALPGASAGLPREVADLIGRVRGSGLRRAVLERLNAFRDREIDAMKTRTHGDLHLGQALCRGEDFAIVDFEGEPARPLAERRAKSSPLRDVTGMIRSFDYAPRAILREEGYRSTDTNRVSGLDRWAEIWTAEATIAYLRGYLQRVRGAAFIPRRPDQLALLLGFHELEKVIYEIRYEANNRPDWLEIPLAGLAALVGLERS